MLYLSHRTTNAQQKNPGLSYFAPGLNSAIVSASTSCKTRWAVGQRWFQNCFKHQPPLALPPPPLSPTHLQGMGGAFCKSLDTYVSVFAPGFSPAHPAPRGAAVTGGAWVLLASSCGAPRRVEVSYSTGKEEMHSKGWVVIKRKTSWFVFRRACCWQRAALSTSPLPATQRLYFISRS